MLGFNLSHVYDCLNADMAKDNHFNTTEIDSLYTKFCENPMFADFDIDKQNELYLMLCNVTLEERKNAFFVGFRTAVSLLLGSQQK